MFQFITLSKKQTDISCGLQNFEILQISDSFFFIKRPSKLYIKHVYME